MRLPIVLILFALLAGCAGAPPPAPVPEPVKPTPPAPSEPVETRETRVIPEPANPTLPSTVADDATLANAFLQTYREQSLYNGRHPLQLSYDYRFVENRWSPRQDRLIMLFENAQGDSGFVAWSLNGDASATSLRLEDSQLGRRFALILRPARLCFAVDAARAPAWIGGRWVYDQQRPGTFECNGLTNRSAFKPGTRLPGLMGVYFREGDVVLLYDTREQRDLAAGILAQLFPNLVFNP
ncbi:hypothetical protein GCM10011348_18260 [Marinobacterium nitratireducens]|uniref:Lipoprotein n=1 Tax=Marinobacterium nitratireducens TaxID=518897 RepID=A0A917ZD28_9GAMM|nr:hypothetical protein [Marinobacterium nitratireducens]GGO80785.1 hypothetical protein GCM10011348_18260 [Marinobacterium nitratireducens]